MGEHEEYVEGTTAGYVGAHEAVVGTATDDTSINVPQTRAGAAENALAAEAARETDAVFVPADHRDGGDVLDVSGSEEHAALRARDERADPLVAAKDAMEDDLRGQG